MDAKPIIVKLDALRAYHSIDRALYAILVTELWRDPVESLQIIALWLWLEQVGFGKVTRKILACPPLFINQTAEEAILCLKCIKDSLFIFSTEATDIPLTRSIIEKEISLLFFHKNRVNAFREVGRIFSQDCLHAMGDIIKKAIDGNGAESSSRNQMIIPFNAAQSSLSNPVLMPFNGGQSSGSNQMMIPFNANAAESSSRNQMMIPFNVARSSLSNPIVMPFNNGQSSGSNQMMIPSNANAAESSSRNQMMIPFNAAQHSLSNPIVMPFNGGRRSELNQMMMSHHFDESMIHNFSNMRVGRNAFPGNYQVINEVPPEDRTMFVTFSRGYPVAEREVRHFFSTNFGDCIESFHMQEVRPHEQPLYARVVFLKPSFIPEILDGTEKAKFTINGKHVWMRKFVPRNDESQLALE
ncbi:uncharacterized protein Fot_55446 [Forsythia ovata]|uniref:RRM domain-containing protein n=1 Tax=Forsythia ovata TaxID=205694 RepID=A0ABD1P4T3_9LAMI